jgi:predicted nucleic acid-binding protein
VITVLDASIAIKWFLKEPETERSLLIATDILTGTGIFAVPELFYFEVFSVVIRKHQQPVKWADAGMRWLLNLPLKRIPMSADLALKMVEFTGLGLTAYDAAYAALASIYQGKWLTFDRRAKTVLNNPDWIQVP